MSRTTRLLTCMLTVLAGLGGVAGAAEPRPWPDYEILVTRNIFSRTRGPKPTSAQARYVRPAAPPAERFVYLRGVALARGTYEAVLEDTRSGQVTRLKAGDSFMDGKVNAIAMGSIRYARGDVEVVVNLGENMEKPGIVQPSATAGEPVEAPPGEAAAAAPDAGGQAPASGRPSTAGGAAAASGGSATDMLERLRQRRMRELGQ